MRRLGVVVASIALALSLFVQSGTAQANWRDNEWCAEDPVIVVFGGQFKVTTSVRAQSGTFAYTLELPSNAAGRTTVAWPNNKWTSTTVNVVYDLPAWSGSGSLPVVGSVVVTATAGSDVVVSISGPTVASATFSGTSNSTVSFSTRVSPANAQ